MSLDDIGKTVADYLEDVHVRMYEKAKQKHDACLVRISKWDDVVPTLDAKNVLVLPWCEDGECEDQIKARSESQ